MLEDLLILVALGALLLPLHRRNMDRSVPATSLKALAKNASALLRPGTVWHNPYLRLLSLVVLLDLCAWGSLLADRGWRGTLAATGVIQDDQTSQALDRGVPDHWTFVCHQSQNNTYRALRQRLIHALQSDERRPDTSPEELLRRQRQLLEREGKQQMLNSCHKGGRVHIDDEGYLTCSKHGRSENLPRLLPFTGM